MSNNDNSNISSLRSRSRPLHLREIAFTFNLISATAYGLLVYVYTHDLDYYLLRAAIRVDDILKFSQTNAVTTEALRRHSQNSGTLFAGMELTILISVFAGMMVVLLFLRLSPSALYRVVMGNYCSGFFALFALPVSYLCTVSWRASPDSAFQTNATSAFHGQYRGLFWILFVADVLSIAILFLVSRVRSFSRWTIGVLLVFHYAFWLTAMSSPLPVASGVLSLSFVAFLFSGVVWLLYWKTTVESAATNEMRRVGKWTVAGLVVSGAMMVVIWYPHRAYRLAQPREIGSVNVELSRGPCFGLCPSYSLTLHGDGRVEYRGIRFVRVKEKQTARIDKEQLMQVLRDLDRIDFFGIEDRAFQWCFDAPSTSILVSVDGRRKRVTTDSCGVGLKDGPKARVLQVADEIDAIAGSKQWVECHRWSCRE